MNHSVRLLFCVCAIALLPACLYAQQCKVSGKVTDAASGEPLANVNISYIVNGDTLHAITATDGRYSLLTPKGRNLTLMVSHIGYASQSKLVNTHADRATANIAMEEEDVDLSEVVVSARIPVFVTRGDTIVYKANAVKTNPDATALDMIRRLPGVSYKDNKLEAQGRNVSEIRVDGKEFYKNDIGMALKNLPKEVIDEVKVFDELSDFAKLAGFDDGGGTVVIDVTTKKKSDDNTFGKMVGGGGTDDRYTLYGVYNRFWTRDRLSLFAQSNNVNEQNFSSIDLLSTTGTIANNDPTQSPFSKNAISNSFSHAENNDVSTMMTEISPYGITQTTAAGANYSGETKNKKMKYSGHYLFNLSDNSTTYDIYDEYFGETTSNNRQHQLLDHANMNHRFNFKYEYQITPHDYIMVRPSFVIQQRAQDSHLTDWTVHATADSLLLNQHTLTDQSALQTSDEVMYMHRFNDKGHSLSFDARFSYSYTEEDMDLTLSNVQSEKDVTQNTFSTNNQKSFAATASYVLPLTTHSRLKTDAGWVYDGGHIKQATETKVNDEETFTIDSLLCGRAHTYYGGLMANMAYMLDKNSWNVVAGSEYHHYTLWTQNDRETIRHRYDVLLPYTFIRYQHDNVRWNFQYKTSQMYPTVFQLLEAVNNSNAILSVKGNNRLTASYHHNLSSRLLLTDRGSGSHFVFFTTYEYANNYIANRRSLSSTSFVQDGNHRNGEMFSYINTDGYWSAKGLLAYGFPLRPIRSNVNVSTMLDYCNVPGFWDANKLYNHQWNWNGFLTVGSNISEAVDFVIDTNLKYTQSTNMAFEQRNIHYLSFSYGAQLKWLITPSLPLTLEGGKTNYYGENVSQYNALIANASIGYKFLKDKRAELELYCHDIFNQDNSFLLTTTELYCREMTTNLLKRHVMFKFTYNFNTMKE